MSNPEYEKKLIPLKQWVYEEAKRLGKNPGAIYMRLSRGKYDWLPLRRVNQRVIFVVTDQMWDWMGEGVM